MESARIINGTVISAQCDNNNRFKNQITDALRTLVRVKVTDATVTITDADGTVVNAADLWLIGSATNGNVTVANAIDIRGSLSHLNKAF